MSAKRPLTVAVIGAGPAGIYAADTLLKTGIDARIDIFEKLPAPYGLVRYGVAPDHPRIKQIIEALFRILQGGGIRLLGNVEIGKDVSFEDLKAHYDAVIVATGSDHDAPLEIPGADLPEVYGGSQFVYWYDGHPDVPRDWPLDAENIAVIGVGNVALDIARMLTKHVPDLLGTDIPANVQEGLESNRASDVHVFGRRGPAQCKFTPLELRELGEVPDVDVVVDVEDFEFDDAAHEAMAASKMTRMVVNTMVDWIMEDAPKEASRRIHIHFYNRPVAILEKDGHVAGIRTERTEPVGDGSVRGTGEFIDTPAEAVYLAVGYAGARIPGVPYDEVLRVIPNVGGRVIQDGGVRRGMYATGWIKRGPVGLIGSTKSDALETVNNLAEDWEAGLLDRGLAESELGYDAIVALLEERGVRYTTERGWAMLDAYERRLGEPLGRERIKVVDHETMTAISREEPHDGKLW
ncbi:MAG TPA: FAD-dependent oxidoreductase [Actinomycetaceae bacterium]|nr:FAD-dependent oxidoreductase [Actinomycetaceae bacterium]